MLPRDFKNGKGDLYMYIFFIHEPRVVKYIYIFIFIHEPKVTVKTKSLSYVWYDLPQ